MELATVKIMTENMPPLHDRLPEMEGAVIELCHAAMWVALGKQTQLSRTGFSIVFIPSLRAGRADLSGDPDQAIAQLARAGLNVRNVTQEQLDGYRVWRCDLDDARSVNGARILITRKFGHFVRMSAGLEVHEPHVRVSLIDGLGEEIGGGIVKCREQWEPDKICRAGMLGAYCWYPDYDAINLVIERLRRDHPRYAAAPIIDNNKKG